MAAPIASSELPSLPHDILMDIFGLLEIPDLVRAGSVCTSWHAAYTSLCTTEHCKLQQTPCLLYTSESAGARAMGLYSLAEKKAYTLTLPDPPIQSREILGSSYGWIITADERSELQLVNPITGDQIALPSVTTIEQVKPVYDDAGAICNYEYSWYTAEELISDEPSVHSLIELRDYLFYKAFLSSDPTTGDYFVALIHNPDYQLSFARAGHDKWTWLPPHVCYEDCLFQGGTMYACTSFGEIHVFDLGAAVIARKIVLDKVKHSLYERIYIVQTPCGELLQIWRSETLPEEHLSVLELNQRPRKTGTIKVHKVDLTSQKLVVETNALGEDVLFIGRNQSLCLCAEQYPQLKANHAYFTDDDPIEITSSWFKKIRRDIGEFDLEKNSNKEIASPQLWSNSPTPVWLVPNPRRMVWDCTIRC